MLRKMRGFVSAHFSQFYYEMKKTVIISIVFFAILASGCASRQQLLLQQPNCILIAKYSNVDTVNFRQLENVRKMRSLPINVFSSGWRVQEIPQRNQRRRISNIEQAIQWLEAHSANHIFYDLYKLSHYKKVDDGFLVKGRLNSSNELIQHYCFQPIRWVVLLIGHNHNIVEIKRWEIDPCPNKPTYEVNITVHFPEFENANVRLPELINGIFYNHLSENIRYPIIALEHNWKGIEKISFVVEIDGSISNIQIIQSANSSLKREVARCIMITDGRELQRGGRGEYPYFDFRTALGERDVQWIPGTKNGEKIPMRIIVEVEFTFDLGDFPWVIPRRVSRLISEPRHN